MRTFYIISETEMKEVGMKPHVKWDYFNQHREAAIAWTIGELREFESFDKHLAAAPVFQHRLNKKGLVSEEDIEWIEEKTGEWDDRSDPPCPYIQLVAIPKEGATDYLLSTEANRGRLEESIKQLEEKEERTFTEKDMIDFPEFLAKWYSPTENDTWLRNGNGYVKGTPPDITEYSTSELLTKYLKQQKHEKRPG